MSDGGCGCGHCHCQRVPLEQILASAPGPVPVGIDGLTDAEVDGFLEAIK